jgi:hypothetical protein
MRDDSNTVDCFYRRKRPHKKISLHCLFRRIDRIDIGQRPSRQCRSCSGRDVVNVVKPLRRTTVDRSVEWTPRHEEWAPESVA